MPASCLMVQGTTSHAGKSVLATALCRLIRRNGIRVAPFKAMNMSNNAWVTSEGGEMAVAQAAQARACGVIPSVEMNPVLLKTLSDHTSEVILRGRRAGVAGAGDLAGWAGRIIPVIEGSLQRLMDSYDLLVIEGAGSPAEINLRASDFANMRVAHAAQAAVLLVGDIDRGGVFAQFVGTWELLTAGDRERIQGFVVNKFRGERSLLEPGLRWLEQRTGRPVLGVVPYLERIGVPEEDSLGIPDILSFPPSAFAEGKLQREEDDGLLRIHVLRYPTISNFTDFEPLFREPGVELRYLAEPPPDGELPHALILPGSRSTMADLEWVRRTGLDRTVERCVEQGVEVVGICGGFQMLGRAIRDPTHAESASSAMRGFGLLPTDTLFVPSKVTAQVKGAHLESGAPVTGYEIHCGRLEPAGAPRQPVFRIEERSGVRVDEPDGCRAQDRPVWGTYLHGLFEEPRFRRFFLDRLRQRHRLPVPPAGPGRSDPDPYDELADAVGRHLDVERILEMAWTPSFRA